MKKNEFQEEERNSDVNSIAISVNESHFRFNLIVFIKRCDFFFEHYQAS